MSTLADYEVLSVMGTGKFGTCYKVQNKLTNQIFVWKSIDYSDMDKTRKQQLLSEIKILKQLSHPNIVKYFNHIVNKSTYTLYIIMECCEGGDLSAWIQKCTQSHCHFEETFIWRVLYQLSKALQRCHSYESTSTILHRDIKPANVFLDADGNIKLGDFGLARMLKGNNKFAQSVVGTPCYMSPEIIKGNKYNRKSDIWSLGCLIYELCALIPPFSGQHMESLSRNITDGKFDRIPAYYSSDLQKIISFMLSVEHGYRPTIEIILHHPTVLMHITDANSALPKLIPNSPIIKNRKFSPNPILASTTIMDPFDKNRTHELRRELFHSPIPVTKSNHQQQRRRTMNFSNSDPEQHYEELDKTLTINNRAASDCQTNKFKHPNEITENIFNEALRQRLVAIKNTESKLQLREFQLKQREEAILKRENHFKTLENKNGHQIKKLNNNRRKISGTRKVIANKSKPLQYDDTIMSIEPNESIILPTIAKSTLTTCSQFPQLTMQRKVSFRSPLKIQKCDNAENIAPPLPQRCLTNKFHTMKNTKIDLERAVQKSCTISSINSKLTSSLEPSKTIKSLSRVNSVLVTKRKSFFGLFNIGNRKNTIQQDDNHQEKNPVNGDENDVKIKADGKDLGTKTDAAIFNINKSQSEPNFHSKWTVEHKRTAFEMLAILNATERNQNKQSSSSLQDESIIDDVVVNNKLVRHDRKRQSMFVLRCSSRENVNF